MPELPEVETMRRGILKIVGSKIVRIQKTRCRLKPISIMPTMATIRKRVTGQQIMAVDRIGKRVVLRLRSGDALVFEPRMTGLVLITDPPNKAHLRLRIKLEGADRKGLDEVLFWDRRGLGTVRLYSSKELTSLLEQKLGPDALKITTRQLIRNLGKSTRPIKPALLDQNAIAGIGNLYASELLHLSQVDPRKRCCDLTETDWSEIRKSMRQVLRLAISYEGSTLSDGTYRNALNQSGGYQNHHRVYARDGQVCKRCKRAMIKRIVQSQRSTFFCPRCQK